MKKTLLFLLVSMLTAAICASCGQKQKPSARVDIWAEDTVSRSDADKIVVPFKGEEGGTIQIQASINGVPFNMYWDTGASITCISALELMKLIKEGRIEATDHEGYMIARLADGSTSENMIFNIREIYIPARDNKHLILNDVQVSVSASGDAPLLIGQNVMRNLPQHVVRYEDEVIVFDEPGQ